MLFSIALIIFSFLTIYLGFIFKLGFKDDKNTFLMSIVLGFVIGFLGSIVLTNIGLSIAFDEYQRSAYEKELIEIKIVDQKEVKRIKNIPIKFEYEKHLSDWEKFSWKLMNFKLDYFEDNRSYYIEEKIIPS